MKKPHVRHPRFWMGVGVTAAALMIAASVIYVISLPASSVGRQPRPPVQTQTLTPTDLDQVINWFGPWQTLPSGSTGSPALVLLHSGGSIDRSSWVVSVDASWQRTDPPQIVNVTAASAKVTFTTDDGKTYAVGYNQPFIIERLPQQVFAFARAGSGYRIVSTTVERVHRLGHRA